MSSWAHLLISSKGWRITAILSGTLFLALLWGALYAPERLLAIDIGVQQAVAPLQTLFGISVFLAITILGDGLGVTLIALGALALLRPSRLETLRFISLISLVYVSVQTTKLFVGRVRPDQLMWLDPLSTYAFPSGHAALATALYASLAAVLVYRTDTLLVRRGVVIAAGLLIVLVGVSRIILNVHYATDVAGGVLLSIFWLATVHLLLKRRI